MVRIDKADRCAKRWELLLVGMMREGVACWISVVIHTEVLVGYQCP